MKDNLYLELTLRLACNEYNLDEQDWILQSFSDGTKTITVGLENVLTGAKLRVAFPRETIYFEEMKTWNHERKRAYLASLLQSGKELHPDLVESFSDVMGELAVDFGSEKVDVEDSIIVEEESTVGKKKFKRKAV